MKPDETHRLPMLCGRLIQGDPHYFPHGQLHGRPIYFCSEYCRNAYEAEPERFFEAHRRKPATERKKQSF